MSPIVLGIETSCDETAVGIVNGRNLLANVISSSVEEHVRFGGAYRDWETRIRERRIRESRIREWRIRGR